MNCTFEYDFFVDSQHQRDCRRRRARKPTPEIQYPRVDQAETTSRSEYTEVLRISTW